MKSWLDPNKFTAFERFNLAVIRPSPGSAVRHVPMHRVNFCFGIPDEEFTEHDERKAVLIGPDKRGVMDMKAEGVIPGMDYDHTVYMAYHPDKDPADWTDEQILDCLENGEYVPVCNDILFHSESFKDVLTRADKIRLAPKWWAENSHLHPKD